MKKITAVLVAAVFAIAPASTLPMTAHAQSADYAAGTSIIMAAGSRAAQVRALRAVPSVGVVDLNRLPLMAWDDSGPDLLEYRNSASRNAAGIRKLRAALAGNPVTRAALEDRGISIQHVVGVRISSNGSLRLYML